MTPSIAHRAVRASCHRVLQLEARAHVTVQAWIDIGALQNGRAVTIAGAASWLR